MLASWRCASFLPASAAFSQHSQEELEDLKRECEDRIGTAEKTIILLRTEREALTKRLDTARRESDARAVTLVEKQRALEALQAEGEALSHKHGRLRQALRDCEAERDVLQEAAHAAAARRSQEESTAVDSLVASRRAREDSSERESALAASVEAHVAQVRHLQASLASVEALAAEREEALRGEVSRLQRACMQLQTSRDDAAAQSSFAAVPLLRQLEVLSRSAHEAGEAASETEARLLARAQAAEAAANEAQSAERAARARAAAADEAARERASHAACLTKELAGLRPRLTAEQDSVAAALQSLQEMATVRCAGLSSCIACAHSLDSQPQLRDAAVSAQATADSRAQSAREDAERAARSFAEAQRAWRVREAQLLQGISELQTGLERATAAASEASSRSSPAGISSREAMPGELAELQRRVSRLEAERARDSELLLEAETRALTAQRAAQETERATRELGELRLRHQKCLELLGERTQRAEELTLDLSEARDIYRSQILMLCPARQ